jgi:hypothetical protein
MDSPEVMLTRLDGKLDRVIDAQGRQGDDIKEVRNAQSRQRDELAKLTGLNIQDRFISVTRELGAQAERLKLLEISQAAAQGERKGVEISAKVVYAFIGIGSIGMLTALARFFLTGSN